MDSFKKIKNLHRKTTRESKILEKIQENPGIHHNALKKELVPKDMAIRTFDKTIQSLLEEELIEVISYGDNKKHYTLPYAELPDEDIVRKVIYQGYKSMDEKITELKGVFQKFSAQEKAIITIQYLNSIFYALNGMTLYSIISDSNISEFSKIEVRYKKKIKEIFNIIENDKQKSIVFPLVLNSILRISEFEKILGIKTM